MATYTLRDDAGSTETIQADSLDDVWEQAKRWVRTGSWNLGVGDSTIWIDVQVEGADGDCIETMTVSVDPPEPRCSASDHDWQSPHHLVGGLEENPGVFGHGGGARIHECCMNCGARRVTDTWAQRPDTGEQGLRSVQYDGPGYYELTEQEAA